MQKPSCKKGREQSIRKEVEKRQKGKSTQKVSKNFLCKGEADEKAIKPPYLVALCKNCRARKDGNKA